MKHSILPILISALALLTLNGAVAQAERAIYDEEADGKEQIAKALEKAKKEDKRVLIIWGANWCGWCHRLDDAMRGDAKVRELLATHYVLIHIDMGHRTKHMDLAREYGSDFDKLAIARSTILDQGGKAIAHKAHAKFIAKKNGARNHSPKRIAEFLEENKKPKGKAGTSGERKPS